LFLALFAAVASSPFNVFFGLIFAVNRPSEFGFFWREKNRCRATNFARMGRNGARGEGVGIARAVATPAFPAPHHAAVI
jgi:hypothetical protein